VILNPEWVTDGVYKVLDNPTVKAQLGRFTDGNLRDIWSDEKYSEKRRELLALMKNTKFEICYEAAERQGWTGALVEQAYRVNPTNGVLRAFVAEHLRWLLRD